MVPVSVPGVVSWWHPMAARDRAPRLGPIRAVATFLPPIRGFVAAVARSLGRFDHSM
jgi:hypothetical protein